MKRSGEKRRKTIAGSRSSEYNIWCHMIKRCYDKKHHAYRLYGGRGISVCQRWHTFAEFFADMGFRPSRQYSIDRIDNHGNYEPGNCRWATRIEQANNTSASVYYTFNGETLTLSELARMYEIPYKVAHARIRKGWTLEEALTIPLGKVSGGGRGNTQNIKRRRAMGLGASD